MIHRRHFTPQMRRRLTELDGKTGLSERTLNRQAAAAQERFAIIDQQDDPAWTALLNEFPHQSVAEAYMAAGNDTVRARRILETRHGKPL